MSKYIFSHSVYALSSSIEEDHCSCCFQSKCIRPLLDSGSPSHLVREKRFLSNVRSGPLQEFEGAFEGQKRQIKTNTYGDVFSKVPYQRVLKVTNVLLVPELKDALIICPQNWKPYQVKITSEKAVSHTSSSIWRETPKTFWFMFLLGALWKVFEMHILTNFQL